MKNKILKITTIIVILSIILSISIKIFAADVSDSSIYEYQVLDDGTIEITGVNYNNLSYNTNLIIPSKIGGKTVTKIGRYSFYFLLEMSSVVIPDTVKTIDSYAFYQCYNLKSVTIGKSVETIGSYAFANDNKITSITIPDSVKQIDNAAFAQTDSITQYTVGTKNTVYTSINGIIYNKAQTSILFYPQGKKDTTYTIPNTVTEIGKYCFSNNKYLKNMVIPDSVKEIKDAAFLMTTALEKITLGKNVEKLGLQAFTSSKFTTIDIPAKLTDISTGAFIKCEQLTNINVNSQNTKYCSVDGVLFSKDKTTLILYPTGRTQTTYTIPNTVKTIGENAFLDAKITSITIPESVTTLGDWCFGRTLIKSITVPSSITTMGNGPFINCTELTTATINSSCDLPYSIFAECSKLANVKINDNVKNFDSRTFYKCTSLTQITLPKNLETMSYSFIGCTNLKSVVIPANVKFIPSGAFDSATNIDISQTKLKKLDSGAYARVETAYVKGEFSYDKAYEVLTIVNQEREKEGRTALKMDTSLLETAMQRAAEISILFEHTRTDSTSCFTANSKMDAENIAAGSSTATRVMNQWMNSAGHKSNILNSSMQSIGIGCFNINGTYYWVQCFGRSTAQVPASKPANKTEARAVDVMDQYITLNVASSDISTQVGQTVAAKTITTNNSGWTGVKTQLQPQSFTWTSSNTKVATVDKSGNVKAVGGGSTTITAKIGDKSISYKVNVTAPLVSISLNNTTMSLTKGGTNTLTVSYNPTTTTDSKTVTWSTSNSKVATVSNGKITAVGAGTATITAKVGNKTATCNVTVTAPLQSISLSPTTLSLAVGGISTLKVSYNPTDTTDSKTVTWTTSNSSVATVSSTGEITAKKVGTATITAKVGTKTATCKLTVTERPTTVPDVTYRTHVQNVGWQNYVKSGAMAGTSGKSLRLEGINIKLENNEYGGSITYQTHVQNIGWQDYVKDGVMSGTSGKSLRLEAIRINLTGEIAKYYDVYYRVHCQSFGWLDWAKNGESAGSAGYSYRLEGIEICLVDKREAAPGKTEKPFIQKYVTYQTHIQNIGWQDNVRDKGLSGTTGQALRLEGIKISLENPQYDGSIEYRTHVQNIGWQNYVKDGAMAGTSGKSLRLEAIQIRLTGTMAQKYDIYYRVHCQNFGWMGWAKNGESAGSAGYSYRLEAIQICIVEKGASAPGSTANCFKSK